MIGILNCIRSYTMSKTESRADEIKNILRRHPADWACDTLAFILDLEQTVKTYRERKDEMNNHNLALAQENDALRKERFTATQRVLELEEELARHQRCYSLSEDTLRSHIKVLQQQRARLENTCEHQAREVNELRRNNAKLTAALKETPEAREVQSLRDEVTRYQKRCAELEHRLRKVRLAAEPSAEPREKRVNNGSPESI
jgi:chromosome segregation ATPase